MNMVTRLLEQYTTAFFGVISAYCSWAEGQSRNQADLLLLAALPLALIALAVWLLPSWIAALVIGALALPYGVAGYMAIRSRTNR